ncbi:hypothetical protein HN873_055634, partial [Arachis hypogaea]
GFFFSKLFDIWFCSATAVVVLSCCYVMLNCYCFACSVILVFLHQLAVGDSYWEKKSKASGLRATANHLRDLNPEDAHEILRQAAEIFEGIGIINIAAQCFSDLGDHEKAGINLKFSFYIYSDEEINVNRKLAKELVDKWSRPIFNKSTRFEDMRNAEDDRIPFRRPTVKKPTNKAAGIESRDGDLDLEFSQPRSGQSSSRQHASRPEATPLDFVIHPQSKIDPEEVRARAKAAAQDQQRMKFSSVLRVSYKCRILRNSDIALRKHFSLSQLSKRKFYHSRIYQPMELEEVLSEGHSEDEVDDEVADFEELRRLGNFDNVTNAEKKFMHMWNSFIRKQRAVLAWLSIIAHRNKDMKAGEKLISVADVVKEHWATYGRNFFLDMSM